MKSRAAGAPGSRHVCHPPRPAGPGPRPRAPAPNGPPRRGASTAGPETNRAGWAQGGPRATGKQSDGQAMRLHSEQLAANRTAPKVGINLSSNGVTLMPIIYSAVQVGRCGGARVVAGRGELSYFVVRSEREGVLGSWMVKGRAGHAQRTPYASPLTLVAAAHSSLTHFPLATHGLFSSRWSPRRRPPITARPRASDHHDLGSAKLRAAGWLAALGGLVRPRAAHSCPPQTSTSSSGRSAGPRLNSTTAMSGARRSPTHSHSTRC